MAYYRVYCLDEGGHIRRVEEVDAGTDAAAVDFALSLAPPQKLEIWNRGRLVRRVEPERSGESR